MAFIAVEEDIIIEKSVLVPYKYESELTYSSMAGKVGSADKIDVGEWKTISTSKVKEVLIMRF